MRCKALIPVKQKLRAMMVMTLVKSTRSWELGGGASSLDSRPVNESSLVKAGLDDASDMIGDAFVKIDSGAGCGLL